MSGAGGHEVAWYVIRVRGAMDPGGIRWFEGFTVAHDSAGNTILSGEVVDQAAFYGLISRARDLGLTILAVERMDPDRSPAIHPRPLWPTRPSAGTRKSRRPPSARRPRGPHNQHGKTES